MTAPSVPARTISIPVSAATHAAVGVVLALIAVMAFWVHIELPIGHIYRGTALAIGVVGSGFALTYWAVCTVQCGRAETADVAETLQAVDERQRVILAAVQGVADQGGSNADAVGGLGKKIAENTGALEALQDTYLNEGKPKRRGDQVLAE